MTADQLRTAYLDFFKERDHAILNSAPLVPENDPTVLFTTAGMHPLVPYLLGAAHPQGRRLASCQKCMRTGDIDEVGDTTHLTFFEMLGNWSLGDYFKEEAIALSYEFLTRELGIPPERLHVSCFAGDDDAPRDQEAADIWKKMGIAQERIHFLGKKHNWWGPAGQTGPCGPDTEMFYVTDAPECGPDCDITCNCGKYVEIWNDVFMQYNKNADGAFTPLEQKNVDTGMGVERVVAVLQGKQSCYETAMFAPLFEVISEITGMTDPANERAGRIIAEHLRAATFLLADGVVPSNVDQGYVLRRLIRRAIRSARSHGVEDPFASRLADAVIEHYGTFYTELRERRDTIIAELNAEEKQFAATLERGIREFNKLVDAIPDHVEKKQISGRKAFFLYETYGFPFEVMRDMAEERGFVIDEDAFRKAYEKHQEASRAGAEKKFKGGLADNTEKTARLHTATHLLHEALRRVLGDHVKQAGSNITEERLRFDFTHGEKMTPEEKQRVEALVNEVIQRDVPICVEEMTLDEARAKGAMGLFEDRYGERIKVYSIGDFSCEVCGGPHVANTGSLGRFKLKKEESSSRGVRRIKAVLQEP